MNNDLYENNLEKKLDHTLYSNKSSGNGRIQSVKFRFTSHQIRLFLLEFTSFALFRSLRLKTSVYTSLNQSEKFYCSRKLLNFSFFFFKQTPHEDS